MNFDNINKYLGITAIILVAVYLGFKFLNFQKNFIEGMTSNQSTSSNSSNISTTTGGSVEAANFLDNVAGKSADAIKSQNDKLIDIIAVDKYRTDYENLLIALDEYTKNMILSRVVSAGSKIAALPRGSVINKSIVEDIVSANSLKSFIDTLNSTMVFIDKTKKPGGMFGI
jgi:hypothetical protein